LESIGVCHFDDEKTFSAGWASVGGNKAYRVGGVHSLPNHILWITNIPFLTFQKNKIFNLPHIKMENYFRSSYMLIGDEHGISDPKILVEFCSRIFARLMDYSEFIYGDSVRRPQFSFSLALSGLVKPDYVRRIVPGPFSAEITEAIEHCDQNFQAMIGRTPDGSKATNFNFPRTSYFKHLLTMKYPGDGEWKQLKEKNYGGVLGHESGHMIQGTRAILEKLLKLGETDSALFNVAVLSTDSNSAKFQSFGSGFKSKTVSQRKWATLPEIIHMSKFSKIKISGGFSVESKPLELSKIFTREDFGYSFVRGLFLENVFAGITVSENEKSSAVGVYMRACDRILCARVAEGFVNDMNYSVGQFSMGRVTLFLRPTDIEKASEYAKKQYILPAIKLMNR
jgi:hypothetical protein